jgi:DNA ligase-associated metallophosphoesterase
VASRRPGMTAEGEGGLRANEHLSVAGIALVADYLGALYWPEERLLAVADLHLEKGSSFAARGMLLPPYDTADTLVRLAQLLSRYDPRVVVALGDSFHDRRGPSRVAAEHRDALRTLQRGREWVWIAGNHDPDPIEGLGGVGAATLAVGPLLFRHEPSEGAAPGEIAGHLHPVACVGSRGRVRRPCIASDGSRAVLPALGAYAGGLNVRHAAFAALFGAGAFIAFVLGRRRLYAIDAARCWAD